MAGTAYLQEERNDLVEQQISDILKEGALEYLNNVTERTHKAALQTLAQQYKQIMKLQNKNDEIIIKLKQLSDAPLV